MNSNDYQKQAARTLIDGPEQSLSAEEICMLETLLQLHSQLGRLTEKVKKAVLHRHAEYSWSDFLTGLEQYRQFVAGLAGARSRSVFSASDAELSDQNTMILWSVIGLLGESSELAELLQVLPLNAVFEEAQGSRSRIEWRKELGDVAWYHAAIATKLGLQLSDIQEANIDKLKKRFPEGFTTEDSVARVDVAEKPLASVLGQVQQDLGDRVEIREELR